MRIKGYFNTRFGEPPQLQIADKTLNQVDQLRYLGLWIDNRLSFQQHIEKTKASLYRLATNFNLNSKTLLNIYKVQARTIWEYALPIYCNNNAINTVPNSAKQIPQISPSDG